MITFPITDAIRAELERCGIRKALWNSVDVDKESYELFREMIKNGGYGNLDDSQLHAIAIGCCYTHPDHKDKHLEPLRHPIKKASLRYALAIRESVEWNIYSAITFRVLLLILLLLILMTHARAQGKSQISVIQIQNSSGTTIKTFVAPFKIKCDTNLACSISGSTLTMQPSGASGTVTSFSAGNLSPLFTANVATPTSTPALTFALTNSAANTVFGNNTGSSAAPAFFVFIPPITKAAVASNWLRSFDSTTGLFTASQPAFTDISGVGACAQEPALTGDVTTSGCAATIANNAVTQAKVTNGYVDLSTTQTVNGAKTFSDLSVTKSTRDCRIDGLLADGATDDSTALNNCLVNAVANFQANIRLPCGQIVVNSPVNDTNKPSLTISGCQANQVYSTSVSGNDYGKTQTQILCNTRATGSGICWDATGSGSQHFKDFSLCNNTSCSNGFAFSNSSNVAFMFGRDNAVSGSGWITGTGTYCFAQYNVLENVFVFFDTRPAATAVGTLAIYNVGAELFSILGGKYIADVSMFNTPTNDLALSSPFQTLATGCPASMANVKVSQSASFQAWTGSAFNIRGGINIETEASTFFNNGAIGTNHNAAINIATGTANNLYLRGDIEQFDTALAINVNIDHLVAQFDIVSPTAGVVVLGAATVTNSEFKILQRNGTPQPLFQAASSGTVKASTLYEGTLSGSGTGANLITLTESTIYAPGLADAAVNTFQAGSNYEVLDDTGSGYFGNEMHRGTTSGSIIIAVPAVAGANTATFPAATGTILEHNTANTMGASGTIDLSAASATLGLKVPVAAGGAPTVSGQAAYDSTANQFVGGVNGTKQPFAMQGICKGCVLNLMVTGANFVTAANTNLQTITGLSFTFPATTALNAAIDCDLAYSQQTAAVSDAFGFQDATVAPTNLEATGFVQTTAAGWTDSTLTASSTTTATNIVAFTPTAITTIWHAKLHIGLEQPSNASTSLFSVMAKTGTAADTLTVFRGSGCLVHFQ